MAKTKVSGVAPLEAKYVVKDGEAALIIVATFKGGRMGFREEIKEILDCIRQFGVIELAVLDAPPTHRTREDVTNLW